MDSHLLDLIQAIPNEVGVYFIFDQNDQLIYIGKIKRNKKTLVQRFKSTAHRELKNTKRGNTYRIELLWDETIVLLQESHLTKPHVPQY